MRAFALISFALLVAVGAAFESVAWAGGLVPRFENAQNMFSGLVTRAPKGGGKGGGGGSKGGGSKKGGGSDDCDGECPSDQKACGDYCIPTDGTCCDQGDVPTYCQSDESCVLSSVVDDFYKCCPSSDSSCDAESRDATYAETGDYQPLTCDASSTLLNGMWALGAAGIVVAFGV